MVLELVMVLEQVVDNTIHGPLTVSVITALWFQSYTKHFISDIFILKKHILYTSKVEFVSTLNPRKEGIMSQVQF